MSVRCITWAFDVRVGDHIAKAVLVKLADNANDHGIAWPSIRQISHQTEIPERTVKRKLAWLEAEGFIGRNYEREEGRFARTVYRLLKPEATEGSLGATVARGEGSHQGPTREGTHASSSSHLEPSLGSKPSAEGSARELRSAIWDALVAATGITPEAHAERTRFGMSVSELVKLGATPEQIEARAAAFRERYPGATVTDRAICNRWGELANGAEAREIKRFGRGMTTEDIKRRAAERSKT